MDPDLLSYLETYLTPMRKQRIAEVLDQRTRFLTVVMEDIFQMHNTSAVVRSCEVFGIQDAHVIENRFAKRLDRHIAMGAQKWVDVHRYTQVRACLGRLREDGYRIIACTPHDGAVLLDDFRVTSRSALCFGTEKEGLSEEILEQADERVKIPMYGFTESLNISVAASIVLQQLGLQLRSSTLSWQLSQDEKMILRGEWTKKSINHVQAIIERYYHDLGHR